MGGFGGAVARRCGCLAANVGLVVAVDLHGLQQRRGRRAGPP